MKIVLWLLTAISIYIILYVGLGYLWAIGVSDNAEKINQVLLNLSYSYLAGCIFYFLVTWFPDYMRKQKVKKIIASKYEKIKMHIEASVQSFYDTKIENGLNGITQNEMVRQIRLKQITDKSFQGNEAGVNNTIVMFLCDTRNEIVNLCNLLLALYKNCMDIKDIEIIEGVANSNYCNLLEYPTHPTQNEINNLNATQSDLAKELYSVIQLVRKLN